MTSTHLLGVVAIAAVAGIAMIVFLSSQLVAALVEARRQRAAARESRERLANLTALAADWVWETDGDHRFVFFSERFAEVTGLDPGDYIGRRRDELPQLDGFDAAQWREHLETLNATRPFKHFQYTFLDPAGRERTFSVSGQPVFDDAGRFCGYQGTGTDLTDVMRARAEAKAAEEHAREVLGSALDAFVSITADGVVVAWNRAAEAMFGWSAEEVRGRPVDDLIVPDSERSAHARMLERLRSGATDLLNRRVRTFARHRSGAVFPCELTITETGTPLGRTFNAFLRDVTQQEEHERAVQRARQEAELASRAKSDFLAAMSHELRTPLNAVIGFSDLLLNQPDTDTDRRQEYIADIRSSGAHLLDLINDVLDLSKIEAGRLELDAQMLDVGEVCRACQRLMAERAGDAGVALTCEIAADLPSVVADLKRLKQILFNLLGNAVKFTQPGGSVTLSAKETASGDIRVAVADTGIGMLPHQVAKALEPFRQLDTGYARQKQGTGLGLALAKRLAELHDGRLEVETAVGAGTTVSLVIPAERATIGGGSNETPGRPGPASGHEAGSFGHG